MAEILQRHIRETPPPIASIALDCPAQLEALVAELLAKAPTDRPEDAESVARRLREIDQGVTIKMPRFDRNKPTLSAMGTETVSTSIPTAAAATNRWLIAGLAASAIIILLLLLVPSKPSPALAHAESKLISGLTNPNPQVRIFAATALGETGPGSAEIEPALIGALSDTDDQVRIAVVEALGKTGGHQDALLALLKTQRDDTSNRVREAAEKAQAAIHKRPASSSTHSWLYVGFISFLIAIAGGATWAWRHAKT
jgi:hypothetical protein